MELGLKTLVSIAVLLLAVEIVTSKPVNRGQPQLEEDPADTDPKDEEAKGTGLEYDRYLQQVVEALESDDDFRKKLETANVSDIKSGAIAMHLQLVNKAVRTKLDEIKRMEIQRLQQLARLKSRVAAGGTVNRMEIPGHLDLRNPHSFEVKDLEHLILKTTKDLEEVDVKRRQDFKEYEMEKEYEYQKKLKEVPEEERQKIKEHHEELQQKHKQHEKIQHPGSKDQFEEVWENEDKMEDQDFDPKTFFMMHDLNEDRFWDIQEVEAVLQRELEKVYDARNSPEEDDPMEKEEEMNRMREHVFKEIDQDKDLMISIEEFLEYTGKHGENKKFEENEGWEMVDDKPAFTDEEYQEYIQQHHAQPGEVPPPVDNNLHFQPEEPLFHPQQPQQVEQRAQQEMPQGVRGQNAAHHQVPQQGIEQLMQGQQQQGGLAEQQVPQQGIGQPIQGHQEQGGIGQQARPQEVQHPPQPNNLDMINQAQPVQNLGHPGENQPQQGQPDQGQPLHHQPAPPPSH